MADLKISELSALAGANLVAADELAIVDDSASETKKITVSDLIANGVTVISDSTIPGAKILFGAGDVSSAAIADSAVATAKIADDAVTAAKLADESTVDLVTTLPASGAFTGQLALDTDDNNLYLWDGSAWQNIVAPGSVNTVSGSTTGEINIVATTSGSTVTISATIDDTTSAAQFLAGPTGSGGTVGYRTIVGTDLPVATTSDKGGVVVNGNGLVMDGDTLEIDNTVTSSATHHVVTYDANGLITGGRVIASADLPIATNAAVGGVIAGTGLTVDVTGNLSIDNSVTPGTYTKVTVTSEGVVSAGDTLAAADIPDHSAAKLTSGTIGTSLIANDAITSDKMADQSTTKFGGAAGSDNVTIFPTGDFKGQFFYDETTQDLYIYTGSSFVPITVLSGNLVNAGAYNASTNQMSSVTSAGSSAGFSVGAALPAPAQTNLNHYVVVDTSGTGSGAAPAVALAPPDMLLSQGVGTEYSLIDVSNAIAGQTASNISLIATGNIVATDVQAGIQELDSEKLQKAGDTMTGALGIGTASSIVFEGSTADDYETTLTVTDPTADHTITFPDVTGNVVTTGDTGTVTSTMITDGTIVNADINASAEIAVSKLADGAARQLLQTDAAGTGVEWASNIDIPGTLDVTSAATFDSTVTATGLITANGKVSFPAGTAAAPGLYSGTDIDTGIYAPGANEFGVATAGTAALTIDSSQRVGIGTTSASTRLEVVSNTTPQFKVGMANDADRASLMHNGSDLYLDTTAGGLVFRGASNTERMRIDSSGRLSLGNTANASMNSAMDNFVLGSGSGNEGMIIYSGSSSSGFIGFNDAAATSTQGVIEYNHSGNHMGFRTADAERMRIDSSGRLGLGTSSPGSVLEVKDNSQGPNTWTSLSDCVTDASFRFKGSNHVNGYGAYMGYANTTNDAFGIQSANAAGAYAFPILLNPFGGNVGIGTTAPGELLTVNGVNQSLLVRTSDLNGSARIKFNADDGNYAGIGLESSALVMRCSNSSTPTERARIDSSGRLLVGTSSARPIEPYGLGTDGQDANTYESVADTSPGPGIALGSNSSTTGRFGPYLYLFRSRGSSVNSNTIVSSGDNLGTISFAGADGTDVRTRGAAIYCEVDGTPGSNDMPGRLVFSTTADGASSPTERVRITDSGETFTFAATNGWNFRTGSSANTSNTILQGAYGATSTLSGTTSIFIYSNGDIKNTNNSYGGISDIKLKENIVDANSQWDDIKDLRVRNYNFIEGQTHTQIGVVAQEVETVSPGLVTESPDRDEDGNDLGTVTKSVNYSVLYMKAVKALQEAMERIETLEANNADLLARVSALEAN